MQSSRLIHCLQGGITCLVCCQTGTIITASPGTATFDGDQHSGAAGFAAISTAPRLYLQDDVCLGLGSVVLLDTDRL